MSKMMKRGSLLLLAACMTFMTCKLQQGGEDAVQITDLKIEDEEVSQWVESAPMATFSAATMYGTVNGAADECIERGLVEGMQQKMKKSGTDYVMQLWLLDHGTPDKAKEMYDYKLDAFKGSKEKAGTFAETEAFIENSPSYGADGYAHFGKYYIWFSFNEYGSNKSEAKSNVVGFLEVMQQKIGG